MKAMGDDDLKENMNNKILWLISLISTGAENYVRDAFAHGTVSVVYYEESTQNHGVFCLVENKDCVIAYAAFIKYSHIDILLDTIANELKPYLMKNEPSELCFNVYEKNSEIIAFVRELGFATDMEVFQLEYLHNESVAITEQASLTEKGFTSDMLEPFIRLFEG
ncbi:MAG: hypothetical protein K6T85_07135, partial [Gorillibacterium sp.]|nr:hypothetical protein [Gorillibacterium sp.]